MAETGSIRREKKSDAARLLLAAARERFAVAATDLLLPEQARLTEWQRLTAASLLTRLLRSIEDEFRARLASRYTAHEALHAALSSAHVPIALPILERAGVLRDAELGTILVRRVEEHRFWKAQGAAEQGDFLVDLVRDGDEAVSAEAMELIVARSRRFDRFQEPVLGQSDLPAEMQHRLVWMIAAALRQYMVQQHGVGSVDAGIGDAASAILKGYDEGTGMEARAMRLARRLRGQGRIDGGVLSRALTEGTLPFFIAGLAVLAELDYPAVWEILSDPRGRGPALILRAAGVGREDAAIILLTLNTHGRLFSGVEGDATISQLELYSSIDEAAAHEVLRLWQINSGYRAFVARISTRARTLSEAA